MRKRSALTPVLLAGSVCVLFGSLPALGQTPSPGTHLDLLKAQGINAAITVFPVKLGPRAMPEAGEVLAILLEHGGMRNVDWTPQVFPGSSDTDFGDYLRRNPVATEYALHAEVLGAPGVGITEIRALLVDKSGETVWNYRQTPQDQEFQKAKPGEPLDCIVMLVNALREPLSLHDPFGPDAYEGRLSKQNAERTGLPTQGERAAMRKALLDARPKFAGSRVAVFPVLIDGQPDRQQAAHLAEALRDQNLGKAEVAAAQPAIEIQTVPNEQQRLWQMARAIRQYLRQTPVTADYALYADYAFAPDGNVFLVHFVICDGAGEWVIVDFQNSHAPDFHAIAPKSADDCDRLVAGRLTSYLSATE